jgi:hypothetical protein
MLAPATLLAQPKITFDKIVHDFGKVKEADGAAVHDFTFKNTGTAPLIIQNVTTTCGCTTPEWTKQPIPPGSEGFIKVSYDVRGRPGAIDKTITVSSNTKPATTHLRITGEVSPVDRQPAEAFRYTAGALRMDNLHVSFSRVYSYEKPTLVATAYNPGTNPVKISFVHLPSYIKVDVSPSTIRKDEKASIKITYDAAGKNEWGFVSDLISMIQNDDTSKEYKLTITANIQEDFSKWTNNQLQNAPSALLEKSVIEGEKIKKGEKAEYKLKMTNNGKSKLLIRKAESTSQQVKVTAPKEIAPGASSELLISYDTTGQTGLQSKTISIITNDPKNPSITVRLKVEVIE